MPPEFEGAKGGIPKRDISGSAILRGFCWVPRRKEIAKKNSSVFIFEVFRRLSSLRGKHTFRSINKKRMGKKTGVEQS